MAFVPLIFSFVRIPVTYLSVQEALFSPSNLSQKNLLWPCSSARFAASAPELQALDGFTYHDNLLVKHIHMMSKNKI